MLLGIKKRSLALEEEQARLQEKNRVLEELSAQYIRDHSLLTFNLKFFFSQLNMSSPNIPLSLSMLSREESPLGARLSPNL
jgi:hypothetical protein